METQSAHEQKAELSPGNLTTGKWITAISSCAVIVSFLLPWASLSGWGSVFVSPGYSFLVGGTSKASGLPLQLFLATPVAVVGCLLLCLPFLKAGKQTSRLVPVLQIGLATLGVLPFFLLPYEFSTWLPKAVIAPGLWIAILGMVGVLIGAIVTALEGWVTNISASTGLRDVEVTPEEQTSPQEVSPPQPPTLTGEERSILELVAKGLSNLEIADKLGLSPIHTSLVTSDLLRRFGAESKTDLVKVAQERGYLSAD